MSYDLFLVRVPTAADPVEFARITMDRDEEANDEIGHPIPEKEAKKQEIARALIALDPQLSVFRFDYSEISRFTNTPESEARLRYRHVELNGPEDGPGIQITIYDDTATVTVPYWHTGAKARQVWETIWSYLKVLERVGGFTVYDPQRETILRLKEGADAVIGQYQDGVRFTRGAPSANVRDHVAITTESERRPWWRFWDR